jgi:hypothetical protein
MNIQQYCQLPTLQQSHNGLPTNSQINSMNSNIDAGHAGTHVQPTVQQADADAIADVAAATAVGAAADVNNAQSDSSPRISLLKAVSRKKTHLLNAAGTGHSISNDSGAVCPWGSAIS